MQAKQRRSDGSLTPSWIISVAPPVPTPSTAPSLMPENWSRRSVKEPWPHQDGPYAHRATGMHHAIDLHVGLVLSLGQGAEASARTSIPRPRSTGSTTDRPGHAGYRRSSLDIASTPSVSSEGALDKLDGLELFETGLRVFSCSHRRSAIALESLVDVQTYFHGSLAVALIVGLHGPGGSGRSSSGLHADENSSSMSGGG